MFSKTEKKLNEINNFNPPPGYYATEAAQESKNYSAVGPNFPRQDRFSYNKESNPGPGAYYNDRTDKIRKRIIDDSKKREGINKPSGETQIKISSIPSIPKKSATRVYEELAPGILILHEQENENSNIGPGSYNANPNVGHKKALSYKINPEHRKKAPPPEPEIKIPTIAEEIRNEKRLMYKKNLIKSTGPNKNIISPSDLCLEVIILRERLMRSDENPPPGSYNVAKYQTSFKEPDPDLLPEYQLMMGKQERFKEVEMSDIGPGAYEAAIKAIKSQGGFISKEERKMHSDNKLVPGPGAYKVQSAKGGPTEAKGNYPPIFGSGCNRFYSVEKKSDTTPGPGSYKLDTGKRKKQKFFKVKKHLYESQLVKPEEREEERQDLYSVGGDKSRTYDESLYKNSASARKNNHYFASKVDRFKHDDKNVPTVGPGNYKVDQSAFAHNSFNRNQEGYIGSKQQRFDDARIRPNLGPGAYYSEGR